MARGSKKKKNIKCLLTPVTIGISVGVLVFSIIGKDCLLSFSRCVLLTMGADAENVFCFMSENAQFLGNAAWTMTSLVGAFSIFYYSSLGNRNYGVENRTIVAYVVGKVFVPCLLVIAFVSTLWMSAAYYLEEYACFFFIAFYLIFIQMAVIFVCITLTTRTVCCMVICREEKRRYLKIHNGSVKFGEGMAIRASGVVAEEISDESMELLKKIFKVPYLSLEKMKKGIRENGAAFKERESIYYYWYQNLRAIVEAVSERGHIAERNKMYAIFYEILEELWEGKEAGNIDLNRMESLSAVFQTLILYGDNKSIWDAIEYIINQEYLANERLLAIGVLLASVSYLVYSGQLVIEEEWDREAEKIPTKEERTGMEADAGKLKQMVEGIGRLQLGADWPLEKIREGLGQPEEKKVKTEFVNQLYNIIRVWGIRTTQERLKEPSLCLRMIYGLSGDEIGTPLERLMTGLIRKMSSGG